MYFGTHLIDIFEFKFFEMGKKQMIALAIIVVSFVLFFYKAFLDFSVTSPTINLFAFVGILFGTLASIAIGNSGAR
jgi:hypothetical protein